MDRIQREGEISAIYKCICYAGNSAYFCSVQYVYTLCLFFGCHLYIVFEFLYILPRTLYNRYSREMRIIWLF